MATFRARHANQNETGTSGRDVMNGGYGNDTLKGVGGNDILNGGAHSDILVGGEGNDVMSGGSGADTFSFKLPTITVETFTFTPSANDGSLTFTQLIDEHFAWVNSLPDIDGDGITWSGIGGSTDPSQVYLILDPDADNDPSDGVTTLATGSITGYSVNVGTYYLIGEVTATTVTGGETGQDVITDFVWGQDTLALGDLDLTEEEFAAQFKVAQADVNHDGKLDTIFGLADDSWTVTLLGVSGHPVEDFYGFAS